MDAVVTHNLLASDHLRWEALAALIAALAQLAWLQCNPVLSFSRNGYSGSLHKMFSMFASAALRYPRHSSLASSGDVHLFLLCSVTTFGFVTVYLG